MSEIREKDDTALATLLSEKREELRKFRFNVAGSALRDVRGMRIAKQVIARILTERSSRARQKA